MILEKLPEFFIDSIFIPAFHDSLPIKRSFVFPAQRNALSLYPIRKKIETGIILDLINITLGRVLKSLFKPSLSSDSDKDSGSGEMDFKLPGVLEDFLNFFDDMTKTKKFSEYYTIGEFLEGQILKGSLNLKKLENKPGPIIYKINPELEIELVASSSMVQQLSPIILYLKHLAKPGDLIVIDEPESDLHPEAQLRIAEALVYMVNRGIKVLITTHSPYIVEHINNLMYAYVLKERLEKKEKSGEVQENLRDVFQKVFNIKFREGFDITDLLISPNKVAVYFFNNGTITSIFENFETEEPDIDWETFSKVSDRLEEFYFELEKLRVTHSGD